ncbi:hypothetical protein GGR42_000225 [Saonia flava]|uniref:DUF4258 domain-containing protein n=1 Tax=Saonia flava TaxID=523696 RepID=A0A846QTV1_9FLAO|nr:DUF4258 domain-containing protein [Saonia flava]NJB69763.1 hypothetical protein [Saonia flava]
MALLKRIGFYLVGLSIGIVFLTLFLKKKSEETGVEFCYFPNCRVLKDMRSKPLFYSDEINKMLQEKKLDSLEIANFFTNGDIDFGKSNTKTNPCKSYLIEGEVNGKDAFLKVDNCTAKLLVKSLEYN